MKSIKVSLSFALLISCMGLACGEDPDKLISDQSNAEAVENARHEFREVDLANADQFRGFLETHTLDILFDAVRGVRLETDGKVFFPRGYYGIGCRTELSGSWRLREKQLFLDVEFRVPDENCEKGEEFEYNIDKRSIKIERFACKGPDFGSCTLDIAGYDYYRSHCTVSDEVQSCEAAFARGDTFMFYVMKRDPTSL